jgi:hypothetical protein
MAGDSKTKLIKDACRRYPEIGSRTIAQYLVTQHPGVFNKGDRDPVEIVRGRVRYYRGKQGTNLKDRAKRSGALIPSDAVKKMPASWNRKIEPFKMPPGLYLILPDVHTPFHDMRALEGAIKKGQIESVDSIFLGGDFQDCASVGYWTQGRREFMEELNVSLDLIDFIRGEFPDKKIYYKLGNHENRLSQYYRNNAPVLGETMMNSVEALYGIESRGIELIEPNQKTMFGKLTFFHGHEMGVVHRTVNPARGLFQKIYTFGAMAHNHSTSMHTEMDINDNMITTWSFGCLCNIHPSWRPFGNRWNHGFGLINVENNGDFEVENRRVLKSGDVV